MKLWNYILSANAPLGTVLTVFPKTSSELSSSSVGWTITAGASPLLVAITSRNKQHRNYRTLLAGGSESTVPYLLLGGSAVIAVAAYGNVLPEF